MLSKNLATSHARLRAGFCTQAARAGTQIIMRHSRHRDVKTLREYIREGGLFQENPTDSLGPLTLIPPAQRSPER